MQTRFDLEHAQLIDHQVNMERLRARIARRPGRWRRRMRPRSARRGPQSPEERIEPQAA